MRFLKICSQFEILEIANFDGKLGKMPMALERIWGDDYNPNLKPGADVHNTLSTTVRVCSTNGRFLDSCFPPPHMPQNLARSSR